MWSHTYLLQSSQAFQTFQAFEVWWLSFMEECKLWMIQAYMHKIKASVVLYHCCNDSDSTVADKILESVK